MANTDTDPAPEWAILPCTECDGYGCADCHHTGETDVHHNPHDDED